MSVLVLTAVWAAVPQQLVPGRLYGLEQTSTSIYYQVNGEVTRVVLLLQESLCQLALTAKEDDLPLWVGSRFLADQVDIAGWQFNSSTHTLTLPERNSTTRYIGVFLSCAANVTRALYSIEANSEQTCHDACLTCANAECSCPEGKIGEDCRFYAVNIDDEDGIDMKISSNWQLMYSDFSSNGTVYLAVACVIQLDVSTISSSLYVFVSLGNTK